MKSYLRFLLKNKLYTTVEVVGMAVAIAFVVFIGTFVIGELRTDRPIKEMGNIYCGHSERLFIGSATIREQLEGKFPEIEDMCGIFQTNIFGGISMDMIIGDQKERQDAIITNGNFFEFFPFKLTVGTPETVLKEKNSVVISESCALRMFGDGNPIGKSVTVCVNGNETVLSVSGVFENFKNTIFHCPEIIYRLDVLDNLYNALLVNGSGAVALFFKVADGADVAALEEKVEEVVRKEDFIYLSGLFKDYHLTAFEDINKLQIESMAPFEGIIDSDFVDLFIAAGMFLLLFAILNYISLTVAQTGFRAKEMASRRLLGTQQGGIVLRYISESFLLTSLAFAVSLLIVWFVSPYFSELIEKDVYPLKNFGWIEAGFMLMLLLLLSLCSGIVPALLVSRFKPIDVVRGSFRKTSKMTLGKILVGFQAAVSFVALSMATIMFLQLRHMLERPVGYEKDSRICVCGANRPSEYYLEELKSLPCVSRVGWLQFEPMSFGSSAVGLKVNGTDVNFDMYYGDQEAFEILGFKVIRKNAEPVSQSAWLPESTMLALGLNYDCTEIKLDNGYIPVCGIVSNYFRGSSEMVSKAGFMNLLWIKEMLNESDFSVLRNLVVQVSGNEDEAVKSIKAFYESKGLGEDKIKVYTYNEMNKGLYDTEDKNVKLISLFTMLTVLLTMLALFAMSTYYARQHSRDAALKKVMGCGRFRLFIETSSGFIKSVIVSIAIAAPLAWIVAAKWLEGYSYRIDNPLLVYLLAVLFMLAISVLSISWQTIKLMNLNPVKSLKTE